MRSEIMKRTLYGIAYGGINTFIALTILMINHINPPISIIWLYTLAGLIMGIYFGLASFIFEIESWNPLKKTIIHFSSSISCFFLIALTVGWVPLKLKPIILSTLFFIVAYAVYWFGYWLYYKKIEAKMNEELLKK